MINFVFYIKITVQFLSKSSISLMNYLLTIFSLEGTPKTQRLKGKSKLTNRRNGLHKHDFPP